jgi:hypothetical protein
VEELMAGPNEIKRVINFNRPPKRLTPEQLSVLSKEKEELLKQYMEATSDEEKAALEKRFQELVNFQDEYGRG